MVRVGVLSENVGRRRKIGKKNLAKTPQSSPKKRNLDQNINDSKSHIWNSFFENIISAYSVFIFVHTLQWTSSFSFNFQIFKHKVSKPTKTREKWHSIYNTVSLKKRHSFLQISTHLTLKMIWSGKQHSQKPFWLYTISSKHVSVSCQKKHFLTAKNYIHEALGKKMSVYLCTSL